MKRAKLSSKKSKKAEIWVSAVIYVLIITTSMVLIIKMGTPIIEKMKAKASVERSQETMMLLDKNIQDVANEGEGSQRVVPIEIKDGTIKVLENQVYWEFETEHEIINPKSSKNIGPITISANSNVETEETNDTYILRTWIDNKEFNISIKKYCCENNWSIIDSTDNLINSISFDTSTISTGFGFAINDDIDSKTGTGYTTLVPSGNNTNLGRASVVTHINSSSANPHYEYDLWLTLESYSDFVIVETRNLVITN